MAITDSGDHSPSDQRASWCSDRYQRQSGAGCWLSECTTGCASAATNHLKRRQTTGQMAGHEVDRTYAPERNGAAQASRGEDDGLRVSLRRRRPIKDAALEGREAPGRLSTCWLANLAEHDLPCALRHLRSPQGVSEIFCQFPSGRYGMISGQRCFSWASYRSQSKGVLVCQTRNRILIQLRASFRSAA